MVNSAGQSVPVNLTQFTGASNNISMPNQGGVTATTGNTPSATAVTQYTPPASYIAIILIIIAVLVAAKFALERGREGEGVHLVGFSVYNLVAITLLAGLGITVSKIIANKYPIVPAFTNVVNTW